MNGEILLTLICLVAFVCLGLERRIAWIAHISGVCLIITIALILASIGFIPSVHPLYDLFTGPAVPIALALMVLSLDISDIRGLPRSLLVIWGCGVVASIIGSIVAAVLAAPSLGPNAPKLAAQLAASYIGGGENAVAMQKIFDIPNAIFVGGFAVDNLCTSLWMVLTIIFARSKPVESEIHANTIRGGGGQIFSFSVIEALGTFSIALVAQLLSKLAAQYIGFLHPILYLTFIAFLIGQIGFFKSYLKPSYFFGTLLFAPFFFSIGAISDVKTLLHLPVAVILMPILVVAIHGVLIYGIGWMLGTPSLETSLASQVLIGGPATGVALAQVKNWRSGVSMGLLTGLMGYASANYFAVGVYYASVFIIERLGM